MRTKSITIWALTSLTFISLIHFVEAISVVALNNPMRLPQLYPFLNGLLSSLTPFTYFWITAISTLVLWGATCLVAFHNPVELYLKKHEITETQLQDKSDALNLMYETVESDHQTLIQLSELMRKMQKDPILEQAPLPTKVNPKGKNHHKNRPVRIKTYVSKPNVLLEENTEKIKVPKKKTMSQPSLVSPIAYYN